MFLQPAIHKPIQANAAFHRLDSKASVYLTTSSCQGLSDFGNAVCLYTRHFASGAYQVIIFSQLQKH